MPIILFVILVILIAQLGFWDTFSAVLGALAMIVLFVALAVCGAGVALYLVFTRVRRRT